MTLYVMLVGAYPFEDPADPRNFRKTIQVRPAPRPAGLAGGARGLGCMRPWRGARWQGRWACVGAGAGQAQATILLSRTHIIPPLNCPPSRLYRLYRSAS